MTLAADNKTAVIDGSQQLTVEAGRRGTISHVLLDEQRAVVVIEDSLAERGDQATIVDLASGGTAVVDQSSAPPTTTGGTWAMGAETLVHATVANDTSYCLATVSLESGQGSPGWCAEPHHGFRGAVITETGLSVMSFDDQRPTSCATLLADRRHRSDAVRRRHRLPGLGRRPARRRRDLVRGPEAQPPGGRRLPSPTG